MSKNNTVTERNVYTSNRAAAWVAALNILAAEYLVKYNDDATYGRWCDVLNSCTDTDLEVLFVYLDLNHHITSLGHMISHNDYDDLLYTLIEFLEEMEEEKSDD